MVCERRRLLLQSAQLELGTHPIWGTAPSPAILITHLLLPTGRLLFHLGSSVGPPILTRLQTSCISPVRRQQ